MYSDGDFDLAGFAVGVAEKSELNRVQYVTEDKVVLAFPSSGIHSNGYSLVRKLFFERLGMGYSSEFNGGKLIDTLLEPTRIYVKEFKEFKDKIDALAHITGGGLTENIPRVLPENIDVEIDRSKIKKLPIFDFIGKYVEEDEMYRTFNMGVGLVVIASEESAKHIVDNSDAYVIGKTVAGNQKIRFI